MPDLSPDEDTRIKDNMKPNRFFGMIERRLLGACEVLVSYEAGFWTICFSDGRISTTISFTVAVQKRYSVRLTERLAAEALYEIVGRGLGI
ncbi:hypothetical protein LCGC14_2866200 [marine sediment metagenome]|uniref:Uncharacterized protein n=1 Tax=marine sediment metagenome TaxID=412755 RepID=A0A0F8YQX8_9ZZZZ